MRCTHGSAYELTRCSNNYKCKLGNCSNKYPCKKEYYLTQCECTKPTEIIPRHFNEAFTVAEINFKTKRIREIRNKCDNVIIQLLQDYERLRMHIIDVCLQHKCSASEICYEFKSSDNGHEVEVNLINAMLKHRGFRFYLEAQQFEKKIPVTMQIAQIKHPLYLYEA